MKTLPLIALLGLLFANSEFIRAGAGEEPAERKPGTENDIGSSAVESPAVRVVQKTEPRERRYIGSSADWIQLRSTLEGESLNSFERARHLESRQLAGKPEGIRRDDDETLVLKPREADELKLADADLDSDALTRYSYYDFVPALDAWVIHVQHWEGDSWLLVSSRNGTKTPLSGLPVVAPDRKRFVTASYDLEACYNANELVVWKISEDGTFEQEWKLEPKDWGPTFIHWFPYHAIAIRVSCERPAPDARPLSRVFRLAGDGWKQGRGTGPSPLKLSEEALKIRPIGDTSYKSMGALPGFAVLTTDRSLHVLRAGAKTPEPAESLFKVPAEFDFFDRVHHVGEHLLIPVSQYDEESRERDESTARGGFVSGPDPAGFLVITDNPPALRWIKQLKIINCPPPPKSMLEVNPEYQAPTSISPDVQDARLIDGKLYIAAYGELGVADLEKQTWEPLEIDWYMEMNRIAPCRGPDGNLWTGLDEGGSAGGVIHIVGTEDGYITPEAANGPVELASIANRLFVATDGGLGVLIGEGEDRTVRHLLAEDGSNPLHEGVSKLEIEGDKLIACGFNRILMLDPASDEGKLLHLPKDAILWELCRFNDMIYATGPKYWWSVELP